MNRKIWLAIASVILMLGLMAGAAYLGDATDEALRPPQARTSSTLGLAGLVGLGFAFAIVQLTVGKRR